MKLWVFIRTVSNCADPNRPLFSYTLHSRYLNSILFSRPYLPRCQLRLTNSQSPCQRCFILLHLYLSPHWPRPILWILFKYGNLKHRCHPFTTSYSNSFCWLRTPMRSNIILRGHSNYQPTLSNPLCRYYTRAMNLRGIFSRQCHPHSILRIPLFITFYYYSGCNPTPLILARNWIEQPSWSKF